MNSKFQYQENLSDLPSALNLGGTKTGVLCDSNSLQNCWPKIGSDPKFENAEIIEVDPGEDSKSHEVVLQLWHALLEMGFDRKDHLICLGGGVVTDLGGFIGTTFKRGMRVTHLPTTLLGMVDASIGGKTGINFAGSKNQIGTFGSDIQTIICPAFLRTLPEKELLSGFAEMIKHAALDSAQHLLELAEIPQISAAVLEPLVERSSRFKEKIVAQDFLESGARQQLNFGHTVGHALESFSHSKNQQLTHGHCVALGMLVELEMHEDDTSDFNFLKATVTDLVKSHYDLEPLKGITSEHLQPFLIHDKKNVGESIMMTRLKAAGEYAGVTSLSMKELDKALSKITS